MATDEFDKVELPAIEQLQFLGWDYVNGEDLSPDNSSERSSLKEVVLEKRLSDRIKRINPWINDQNLSKVVKDLTKTQYTNLIEANQAIWTILNECVSVMQDLGKGNKGQTVHIIDFENPENTLHPQIQIPGYVWAISKPHFQYFSTSSAARFKI